MAGNDEVDGLYELPPEAFVAARNALAVQLRDSGDRQASARVRKLRRPTVAAWAVNQVVRRLPGDVDALLEAGDALRRAQRRLLSGVGAPELRDAGRRRRDLLDALLSQAVAVLEADGRDGAAHRDDIQATFEAASVDEDAAEALKAAQLSRPLAQPSGFGDLSMLSVVPEPEPPAEDDETARDRRRAELDAAEQELEGAERAAASARQNASDADREAEAKRDTAEAAAQEAADLERQAAAARRRARSAATAADEAERAAGKAREAAQRSDRLLGETAERVRVLRAR